MTEYQRITERRGLWPVDWAYMRTLAIKTLFYSDDVRIRYLMAFASLAWSVELWMAPETLDRPYFDVMKALSPWWAWAIAFFLHGAGAIWRIFERKERRGWALAVNGLGLLVWSASTGAQNMHSGRFVPSSSLEMFACAFLFMTFVSSGWGSKSTTA